MRTAALLLTMPLALVACGGDSPTAPPAPQFPNVLGTYQSQLFFVSSLTQISTGQTAQISCPGRMTVSSQSGSQFSGTFVRQPCQSGGQALSTPTSGTISGTVRMDGGTNMSLVAPGQPVLQDSIASLGCTNLSSSTEYNGTFSGNRVNVSASVTFTCAQFGLLRIDQTISGTR